MVRRNASDTSTLPTTGSTLDHDWDTQVAVSGTAVTYSAGTFTLVDTGNYLVTYSDHFGTTSTTNNERINWMTYLRLNGANIVPGQSSGYIRKSGGSQEYIVSGFAIINVSTSSQSLLIRSDRRDNSTTGSPTRQAGDRSGISILKLDDGDAFGRYSTSSNKAVVTGNGSEASIVWDTNDEQDTGFSRSTDSITITSAGRYFISYSVPLDASGSGSRNELLSHLELDTVAVAGSHTQTYLRTTDNSDDGCLSWGGIIDVAALDVLVLRHVRADGESSTVNYLAGSSLEIWQLPAGAETCIVEATSGNFNAAATNFAWDTVPHIDTAGFTHTATNANVDVDVNDDYFVFATHARTSSIGVSRAVPAIQFRVNTTDIEITGGSTYNRNSTSATASISCGGLLTGLTAGDSIYSRNDRIGTASGAIAAQSAQMSLLRLGSLAGTTPAITDVNSDEVVWDGEQDVTITGTDFGGTTGKVYVSETATLGAVGTYVEIAVDTWADTSIQVDIQEITTTGALTDDLELFRTHYVIVEDSSTTRSSGFAITVTTEEHAALNADASLDVDVTYIILARAYNSGGATGTADFRWAYNHNSGGDTAITTVSTHVKAVATAAYLNNDDISEILSGSGTYVANNNAASEDGTFSLAADLVTDTAFVAALSFQIDSTNVANGETGTIRLELNDGTDLDTYTQTFTYTVVEAAGGDTIPPKHQHLRRMHQA